MISYMPVCVDSGLVGQICDDSGVYSAEHWLFMGKAYRGTGGWKEGGGGLRGGGGRSKISTGRLHIPLLARGPCIHLHFHVFKIVSFIVPTVGYRRCRIEGSSDGSPGLSKVHP